MLSDIINVLSKTIDVLTKLKRSDKQRWCSRMMHAQFLLAKFVKEMEGFLEILRYYVQAGEHDIGKVVTDLERLRLHPLSEYLRLPWVVKQSYYVDKSPGKPMGPLGLSGLCLKYCQREDGVIIEFDDARWKPGETPPPKSIIVSGQSLPAGFLKDTWDLTDDKRLSAKQYLVYLINKRLDKVMDRLRDLIHGWSNELHIWEDILDMQSMKILTIDPALHKTLHDALQVEGQYYNNLLLHGKGELDASTNELRLSDLFFRQESGTHLDINDRKAALKFLGETEMFLNALKEHSEGLRQFISKTFDVEEILKA